MMLREIAPVAAEALPVEALRGHLRLGSGFEMPEDAAETLALEGFLRSAIAVIEARTGKALLARQFRMQLDDWRDRMGQALPLAPVISVDAVEIEDSAGAVRPVPPELWRLREDRDRPRLVPAGAMLPHVPRLGSVVLRFTAGFGPGWSDVPANLAQAVLILAAQYYEDRGQEAPALPLRVSVLLEPWRVVRTLVGRGGAR